MAKKFSIDNLMQNVKDHSLTIKAIDVAKRPKYITFTLQTSDDYFNSSYLLSSYTDISNTIKNIPILQLAKKLRFGSNLFSMKSKNKLNSLQTYYKSINTLGVCFNFLHCIIIKLLNFILNLFEKKQLQKIKKILVFLKVITLKFFCILDFQKFT